MKSFLFLLLSVSAAFAQSITPWPNPTPVPPSPITETYKTVSGMLIRASVYNVASPSPVPPRRCAIFVHPGGFFGGTPEIIEAKESSQHGFLGVAIEYRLAPPHTEMNDVNGTPAGTHPIPGQNAIGDDGHYPEQTQDVSDAIIHYRNDPRCNGQVVVIGGSAGAAHTIYMSGTGTPGSTLPDLAVSLSCGISNFIDPNSWPLVCNGAETCPHSAVAGYLNIIDPFPLMPTGAALTLATTASPFTYLKTGMCPIWSMCSTEDSLGIPTSTGYSIWSYNNNSTQNTLENGVNGLINQAAAVNIPTSTSATPEAGTFKTTLVTVTSHEHSFNYWAIGVMPTGNLTNTDIYTWISAQIPALPGSVQTSQGSFVDYTKL